MILDIILNFLRFSRSYILLYSLPTNPLTGIIYSSIAYYGYRKLKERIDLDTSKLSNKLLIFVYSVGLLGFVNFILENVWLISFFVRYTFFNEVWLDQIYFNVPSGWLINFLRNFVYILVLYVVAHDIMKYLNWSKKTLIGFVVLSVYIIGFFILSPHYGYIDWSYALMMNYPNEIAISSFLLSMGGKPMLFYIFYSLFLPRKKVSIDQSFEVLDIGCGAKPRGTVNVDCLNGSDRHPIDLHTIPNLVVADAHYLPFRNKIFDKTLTFHMMEHIQGDLQVYDEMNRVTVDSIEIRVPWHIWEKVMNKVMFWTSNEAFRKEHHLHQYMRKDYLEFLHMIYSDADIQVKYGFLSFFHGLKQEIKRETIFPFPLPFELVAQINLGESN